jgi:2-oxoglutarate dehydrogenase E1 component
VAAHVGAGLLLPHGYEGQGPEHSSARLERFLQLCAEDNMQVANCTTPANYFHILRRQIAPRFPQAADPDDAEVVAASQARVSTLEEMGEESTFHRILWDDAEYVPGSTKPSSSRTTRSAASSCVLARSITTCLKSARSAGLTIYLLRLEQLYPFPTKALVNELMRFKDAEIVWCQEEPQNMGVVDVHPALCGVGAEPH